MRVNMFSRPLPAWLRRLFASTRTKASHHRYCPRLESLENRRLMSVFLVTTTANAGAGSLRQAILDANANTSPNTIEFDIEPGGDQSIDLTSPLPTIANAMTIDGTTQPGWISSPLIAINGSGITALTANGLTATADGCQFKGLIIEKFGSAAGIGLYSNDNVVADCWIENNSDGIDIANAATGNTIGGSTLRSQNVISGNPGYGVYLNERSDANTIEGNLIGTDTTGTEADGNGDGIALQNGCDNNIIGGPAPGQGNVISGNTSNGLFINSGCISNQVEGNLIGTAFTGGNAVPNSTGMEIASNNNTIGGTTAGAGNVISGNTFNGILIEGNSNQVLGNTIGPGRQTVLLSTNQDGIDIQGANNIIGGTSPGAGNTIAYNTAKGVNVIFGNGNAIRGNSFFTNGSAIVVSAPANNNQPAPILTSAAFNSTTHTLTISGSLTAPANTKYTLDFYANAAGDAEGNVYLGSVTVTTAANGKATFASPVSITTTAFTSSTPLITATATDPSGDTSAFSNGVTDPVAKPVKVVKQLLPAPVRRR